MDSKKRLTFMKDNFAYYRGYGRGMSIEEGEPYDCPYSWSEQKDDYYAWFDGFSAAWGERSEYDD